MKSMRVADMIYEDEKEESISRRVYNRKLVGDQSIKKLQAAKLKNKIKAFEEVLEKGKLDLARARSGVDKLETLLKNLEKMLLKGRIRYEKLTKNLKPSTTMISKKKE